MLYETGIHLIFIIAFLTQQKSSVANISRLLPLFFFFAETNRVFWLTEDLVRYIRKEFFQVWLGKSDSLMKKESRGQCLNLSRPGVYWKSYMPVTVCGQVDE